MEPLPDADVRRLAGFVADHHRLFVLTGAGCSTESGIPDYRDADGNWKVREPMKYREFVASARARRRYWVRSLLGWEQIRGSRPNAAHHALARLERMGRLHQLVTQNVDGLHQRAGSRRVIDLHGRLDTVECLACRATFPRLRFQEELRELNPGWRDLGAAHAPDGDADPGPVDYDRFRVPPCERCGGALKPFVVFFGESVPRARVEAAFARLEECEAMLVVGSSLMVWSGYRFVRGAVERGLPIAAVNLGHTRADDKLSLKVEGRCAEVLTEVLGSLNRSPPGPVSYLDRTNHAPRPAKEE